MIRDFCLVQGHPGFYLEKFLSKPYQIDNKNKQNPPPLKELEWFKIPH